MTGTEQRELGVLSTKVEALEHQVSEQGRVLREVRDAIVSAKGGWWMLMVVGGIAGSIGAFLAKFWPGHG